MYSLMNEEIECLRALKCCYVWRSVGSHIFLEFGMPKIKLVKQSRRTIEGDATLHIESDTWSLFKNKLCQLSSESIDTDNLNLVGKALLYGCNFPSILRLPEKEVVLRFSPQVELNVKRDSYTDNESVFNIKLPNGDYWSFCFANGWLKEKRSS